jgi:hypothetical protein
MHAEAIKGLNVELRRLIRVGPEGYCSQPELPFEDGPKATGTEKKPEPPKATGPVGGDCDKAVYDDWMKLPIEKVLKLTKAQLEKLHEHKIKTVAHFEQVRGREDREYPKGLRSIKGVGEQTVDKWENDVVASLKKHRDDAAKAKLEAEKKASLDAANAKKPEAEPKK